MLIEILNTADPTTPERRRRCWLGLAETTAVAGFLLMPVAVDSGETALDLFDAAGTHLATLPLAPASFEPTAPYRIIPRAAQAGRLPAVFLEIQYTGDDTPGWQQREDDNHADLQPISDDR